MMKDYLKTFSTMVAGGQIEIYNEFSLQHEFGIFLRKIQQNMKVQFERNVSFFPIQMDDPIKKEIDLTVFDPNKKLLDSALEFKYPRNGKYPEGMYDFCKDIAFLEQLKTAGFKSAYFIAFTDLPLFWQGRETDGIYGYFREQRPLTGTIFKPTGEGKNIASVTISGRYTINWTKVADKLMYTLVEI